MDSVGEIRRLRRKYETRTEDGKQVKPNFLGKIARMKGYYDGETKSYRFHETAMDYLQHSLNAYRVPYKPTEFLPFSALLVQDTDTQKSVWYPQVERVLSFVRDMRGKIQKVWDGNDDGLDNSEKAILVNEIRGEYIRYIRNLRINPNTVYRLMLAIEEPWNKDIAQSLFYTLFFAPNQSFLELIRESKTPVETLTETDGEPWDIKLYEFYFLKNKA